MVYDVSIIHNCMCVSDMSILMPSEDDLSNTDWIAFPEESITQLFLPFSIIQQEMSQGTFFGILHLS